MFSATTKVNNAPERCAPAQACPSDGDRSCPAHAKRSRPTTATPATDATGLAPASSRPRTTTALARIALGLGVASLAGPAMAIPSPDLVLNLSASFAQVLGLLSVVFGGFAFSTARKGKGAKGQSKTWRWLFRGCVALLLLSVIANVFQYTRGIDETNRRLQTNLIRPSVENGKGVGDTSLKTLSFSAQKTHPKGVTVEDFKRLQQSGGALNVIDVREPEEVEMGHIRGSWHKRYPDLLRDPADLMAGDRENVLICHSGNRSSELCETFSRKGIDCRFLVGGYEKWIAEGNPLVSNEARSADEIRQIAGYSNRDTLLDTPEVLDLVQNQQAVFVDVRYPGDFDLGHLPGALNMPIRKLPADALTQQLQRLPRVPIVAPCYDKRSCFFSLILGSRLSRLGYDYRGRYTVPHEFALPRVQKEHVAAWQEAQRSRTLVGVVSKPLNTALGFFTDITGHLVAGIFLLVTLLRLAFLPLAAKAERDQQVQRSLAPELEQLKRKTAADPQRHSRAVMRKYRERGLTPVRNLIATVAQLVLFLVFFSVVNQAATMSTGGFLWASAAADLDPYYLLPVLVSALFAGFMLFSATRRGPLFTSLYAVAGALMLALTAHLNIAVNFYLLVNVTLMLGLSYCVRAHIAKHERDDSPAVPRTGAAPGFVELKDAHRYAATGQKAIRLSQMMRADLPVPDGFVVTDEVLSRDAVEGSQNVLGLSPEEFKQLYRLWYGLGAERVAVRSSGLNEDGEKNSYAGVFESILEVERKNMLGALGEVRDSLRSRRATAYNGNEKEQGGALVMQMVDAQYAGVLFTEHPASTGHSLVELVSGLGDNLVSGKVTPKSFQFGRLSGRLHSEEQPPVDLEPLLALGRKVEDLFGKPQDIEWAYSGGNFLLLQARDITTGVHLESGARGDRERERSKLLDLAKGAALEKSVFVQNELSELLPRPTPFSASFMEQLWAIGGSADLACRALGIPYDVHEDSAPYVTTVFGALYVNRHEERTRLSRGPGAAAAFRLARSAESIEARFRDEFLPAFEREILMHEALDFQKLSARELLSLFDSWSERFITDIYLQAEIINIATDFYWKTASQKLESEGIDPALFLGKIPETVVHRAMQLLSVASRGAQYIEEFLDLFGHRAPYDYEFSEPRYAEAPELLTEQLARARHFVSSASAVGDLPTDSMLRLAVGRAQRFQVLKEDAKHHCLRFLACIRRLLLEIDRKFELDGGVFQLTVPELRRLGDDGFAEHARHVVTKRVAQAEAWRQISLPSELSIIDLETLEMDSGVSASATEGVLQGTRVAGTGEVVGRVHVIKDPKDMDSFERGEILVARLTDPTWFPLFPLAGGIVTEVGGWLSHAAIVAREFDLTAIVGVRGASECLKTGQIVRLKADGTIEEIEDKRAPNSPLRNKTGTTQAEEAQEASLESTSTAA